VSFSVQAIQEDGGTHGPRASLGRCATPLNSLKASNTATFKVISDWRAPGDASPVRRAHEGEKSLEFDAAVAGHLRNRILQNKTVRSQQAVQVLE